MMREEISRLVLEIGNAIKDFTRGSTALPIAEETYARLQEEYSRLENELRDDDATGLLEGVMYHHNIGNFSLHSGLYQCRRESVVPVAVCGEEGLAERIAGSIRRNLSSIGEDGACRLDPDILADLTQSLHIAKAAALNSGPLYFASLSSSPYFSDESFLFTRDVLGVMISSNVERERHYSYFEGMKRDADAFIRANLDASHDIQASIFIFSNIEKIFDHMGFLTVLDVSNSIAEALRGAFPSGSLCVSASFRMHLVFTRHLKNRGAEIKNTKVEFVYRGITLPFQRLNLALDLAGHREGFWYDIFQFEDFVISGEYP